MEDNELSQIPLDKSGQIAGKSVFKLIYSQREFC